MHRYIIATASGSFVSCFCPDGLLLVSATVGGSPRADGSGACNQAILYHSRETAEAAIAAYQRKRLPLGCRHVALTVQAIGSESEGR
jgi:hypothetical protein